MTTLTHNGKFLFCRLCFYFVYELWIYNKQVKVDLENMDRNKPLPGSRGPKSKITQQPPDLFFALGQKSSTSTADSKRTVPLPKPSSSSHLQPSSSKVPPDRKREGSSSSLQIAPAKKLKVALPGRAPGLPSTSLLASDRLVAQPSVEPWEALVLESEPQDVFDLIITNSQAGNTDKAVSNLFVCAGC